jgi:hypothetical protein
LNRDSFEASINSDGSKIAFRGDADFLGQGIPDNQNEIWLASGQPAGGPGTVAPVYLPLLIKN